jgi:hypothetical protein
MQEIQMKDHINCFRPIEDVIIDDESKDEEYLSSLAPIVSNHCGRIKSITIRLIESTQCTEILRRLNIRSFHTLEMLCLWAVIEEQSLEHILKQNLKCVWRFITGVIKIISIFPR